MAYRVTAPCVHLAGVATPHFYEGRIIASIPSAKQREHLLKLGMVEEIPDPLPPGVAPDPDPAPPVDPPADQQPQPQRPSPTASKDTWVAYIVAIGAAASAEEAAQLTKDQLIGLAPA